MINTFSKKLFFNCFISALSLAYIFIFVSPASASSGGKVPGRFILKLKEGVKFENYSKALARGERLENVSSFKIKEVTPLNKFWNQYHIFISDNKDISEQDIVDRFGADNIISIEPEYMMELFGLPADSLFANQWYLNNQGQDYLAIEAVSGFYNDVLKTTSGLTGEDINAYPYYQSPPLQSTKVVVAIIDSGVDWLHPDLKENIWRNPDEIADGIDNDHNGIVDDTIGYDISGDNFTLFNPVGDIDPSDQNGHGTHLAGIVAASHNLIGVAGIAPWAEIMPVKIFPNAFSSISAAGIMYAVNSGAQIINISWGTPFESGIIKEALEYARLNGVFVAIAPGNTGNNQRFFPAAYDSSFVVAAGNSYGYLTDFSTYGAHIDMVAPGKDILSLRASGTDLYEELGEPEVRIIDSLYYLSDGTSMAAPMVAGAAALILGLRPDVNLSRLESVLLGGARDIVDPWGTGNYFLGYDTLTGHGYLDIDNSLKLLESASLKFKSPIRKQRYTDNLPVIITPLSEYTGSWKLEQTSTPDQNNWQLLSEGSTILGDSNIYTFSDPQMTGLIYLRLSDKDNFYSTTSFVFVKDRKLEISSPLNNDELEFSIPIYGSAYGQLYDSLDIYFRKENSSYQKLFSSTGEYFDSLLYQWTVSGNDTGSFDIRLSGYYADTTIISNVTVNITSAFAQGWPRNLGGGGGITPVIADLNKDGLKEIIVTTRNGLRMYNAYGYLLQAYPALQNIDVRCVPAIYDIDRDGEDEIILTGKDGLHVLKYDGSYASGWPQNCVTGSASSDYGYPNPTVTGLGLGEDSAIVFLNTLGQIFAYEFNGDPYFYSLEGIFATVGTAVQDINIYNGGASPMVTADDLNGDGLLEVVASYSSRHSGGVAIIDGRSGRPAFDNTSQIIDTSFSVNGMLLTDLNDDALSDIVVLQYIKEMVNGVETVIPQISAISFGNSNTGNWSHSFPELPQNSFIASFPVAADLNLDGKPEILVTFFTFANSFLYILNSDGSSYLNGQGSNGLAFETNALLATPAVANLSGDEYPEIVMRAGHILPGTGPEYLYVLDYQGSLLPGYPIRTPAPSFSVISSRYAPLIDDIDNDNLVEVLIYSDADELLVWNFPASYMEGKNKSKFLVDNLNSGRYFSSSISTSVGDEKFIIPGTMSLSQNYPNPFNPVTAINFYIPKKAKVELSVFNLLGQKVMTLIDDELPGGIHAVEFDGLHLASGIYFYKLSSGDKEISKKMVLIK